MHPFIELLSENLPFGWVAASGHEPGGSFTRELARDARVGALITAGKKV